MLSLVSMAAKIHPAYIFRIMIFPYFSSSMEDFSFAKELRNGMGWRNVKGD
ncbi:MAG: hypothetical protein HWD61_07215 [Parachlamydiaceae bacterium]|nr:MAG: hypothetical protein HWD61_07215 [Parachlamydiaceae bacterium]